MKRLALLTLTVLVLSMSAFAVNFTASGKATTTGGYAVAYQEVRLYSDNFLPFGYSYVSTLTSARGNYTVSGYGSPGTYTVSIDPFGPLCSYPNSHAWQPDYYVDFNTSFSGYTVTQNFIGDCQ
jgi:hypothetical protein